MAHSKHFDLNLLRIFMAVCRTQSFTKAAEELDLTQSSVSNAVNRLKANISEELFVRSGRGIKLTTFSQQLYQQLTPHLTAVEQLVSGFDEFSAKKSQRKFYDRIIFCCGVFQNENIVRTAEENKFNMFGMIL